MARLEGQTQELSVEMTEKSTVATVSQRLDDHLKMFYWVVGGAVLWMGGLSAVLFNMNGSLGRVEIAQADAPSKLVSAMLNQSQGSRSEATGGLAAAATVLRTAKNPSVKPDSSVIQSVSAEIFKAQTSYADLPETWQATTAFITYRASAILPPESRKLLDSARSIMSCGSIQNLGNIFVATGCTMDLENSIGADNVLFVHCVIRYRGGPLPMKHVEFINCLFDLELNGIPSRQAQSFLSQMTTAPTDDLKVSVG